MRKAIIALLCVFLCFSGSAHALKYNDIRDGMSYQEIMAVLNGLEIEEKVFETSTSYTAKNKDYNIRFYIKEDGVHIFDFAQVGNKTSSLELFVPDWSLEIDDIMDVLEEEKVEYHYRPRETRYATLNGKRTKLEQPETIHIVNCYGFMDFIPVEYNLTFNQEGKLTEIEIGPSGIKEENEESNYLVIMSYLGNAFGMPEKAETDDSTTFLSEDGGASLEDTCFWENKDSKYTMVIETLIERESAEDEPYEGVFYKNVSLIITPIDE